MAAFLSPASTQLTAQPVQSTGWSDVQFLCRAAAKAAVIVFGKERDRIEVLRPGHLGRAVCIEKPRPI